MVVYCKLLGIVAQFESMTIHRDEIADQYILKLNDKYIIVKSNDRRPLDDILLKITDHAAAGKVTVRI